MTTTTRTARPVYATTVTADSTGPSVRIGTASSKSAAIAQTRAAGYRVMIVGGNIGLEALCSITRSDSDDLVWCVSVYP